MQLSIRAFALLIMNSFLLAACDPQAEQDHPTHQMNESTVVDTTAEKEAAASVLKSYKDAIQKLTTEGTIDLFTKDATVFESGGVEGTYANYLSHHLGPELEYFNSFTFSDYNIDVDLNLPFAFTTETYKYTIDLKADEEKGREARLIEKKGLATSILEKIDGNWKIIKTHSSSRNIRKSGH